MNVFIKSTYVNNLQFQGSSDGISYQTLFTVGTEIHEGWNIYLQSPVLSFRFYRFKGTTVGSCNVGEFVLNGVVAIASTASSYSCTPSLTIGTTATALTSGVTYSSTNTPLLTSISPRYGTVKGGTLVTFTGSNFPTSTASV